MRLVCTVSIVAVSSCLALASCGKDGDLAENTVAAASNAVDSLDLSKLSPEALGEKAETIVGDLSQQLTNLKDSQGAKDLVAKFQPLVDQLAQAKSTLMSQSVDLSPLKDAVSQVTAKFGSDQETMKVLQPLIDKIKSLWA